MFIKMISYDLKNGLLMRYKKYGLAICVFLFLCFDFQLRRVPIMIGAEKKQNTYGDFLFFIFRGKEEYSPSLESAFQFPALWVLVMMLIAYIVLYYPYNDLMGVGKMVLLQSKSRVAWWISKCFWVLSCVAVYYILLYGLVGIFCFIAKVPLSLQISEPVYMYYVPQFTSQQQIGYPETMLLELLLIPFLFSCTYCLLQMLLALWLKPLYSYCVTLAIMIFSSYYLQPFMIGNYAMSLRSHLLVGNGVSSQMGMILFSVMILSFFVIGAFVFRRYDILNKE